MSRRPRATVAGDADLHASDLAKKLGAALRDARVRARFSQRHAAARAGFAQPTWSKLERGRNTSFTLATWDRAAHAVGSSLNAYLTEASAADQPRDASHLKAQELVLRTSKSGGWSGIPEERFDADVRTSRFADVFLRRDRPPTEANEVALIEVIDWFDDVGAPMRSWQRRLDGVERYAIAHIVDEGKPLPSVSGCWVVRATKRNRALIAEHSNLFAARFRGSARAWLAALTDEARRMPKESALLWISVSGDKLYPSRLG